MIDKKVFSNFPLMETIRCRLIEPRMHHAHDLYEIYGDPFTMRLMQSPPVNSIKDCENLIGCWREDFKNQKGIRWAITMKTDPDKLIGTIALHYWSKKNRKIELGADIKKNMWGRGISTEVTAKIIDFAFTKLDINRCELRCHPENAGSVRIAEKFGMKLEGILKEYVFVQGKGFVDEAVFALLRKDYCS